MEIWMSIFCILAPIASGVFFINMKYTYWKRRNIKVPKVIIPFFGHYLRVYFGLITEAELYKEIYDAFPTESVIGLYRGFTPEVLLRSPNNIRLALTTKYDYFENRSKCFKVDSESLKCTLFHMRSDLSRNSKVLLFNAFSKLRMERAVRLIADKSLHFTKYMKCKVGESADLEILKVMDLFIIEALTSYIFGVDRNKDIDEEVPFSLIADIFGNDMVEILKKEVFPNFFKSSNVKDLPSDIENKLKRYLMKLIYQRKKTGIPRSDFVNSLIEMKQNFKEFDTTPEKLRYDTNFICAHMIGFFAAGYETTSSLLSLMMYELGMNKEIQKKLYEEYVRTMVKHGNHISYTALSDMEYLDMVVMETMRKYPAVGFLKRLCNSEFRFIGTEYKIKKGTAVLIPVVALHSDKNFYPNPQIFCPERFNEENTRKRHPMSYLPFGKGPRDCIGECFARILLKIGAVIIIKDFKLEQCDKTKASIMVAPKPIILASKEDIWMKLIKRVE